MYTVYHICFRYGDSLLAMGDSHLRNLFYYTVTYMDPTYINQQKVSDKLSYRNHFAICYCFGSHNFLQTGSVYLKKSTSDKILCDCFMLS